MKIFLSILGGIAIFAILWYFGFLDFIGIKGAGCSRPNTGGAAWMSAENYRYKYGRCEREKINTGVFSKTCAEEQQEAEGQWANTKQACILTIETVMCPRENNFEAQVNPCVGKILKEKGWKNPNVALPPNNPNPPVKPDEIEVTNPNGAILYYQSHSQKSGGKLYSASNVVVPFGQKFTMVAFWQTNVVTQPLAGYYETTYQPYVQQNSFFDLKDVKKV